VGECNASLIKLTVWDLEKFPPDSKMTENERCKKHEQM
jgi:hypothetical protein